MKRIAPLAVGTALIGATALASAPAMAAEHSIGDPLVTNGLIISPVFLQAVDMSGEQSGMNSSEADIHFEADIHADSDEKHGFDPGAWIPYLTVSYKLTKKDSDWSSAGGLMPMVASDGPHYGANVELDGPGKYTVQLRILPPSHNGFSRHTTKDTGVPAWWSPITHTWKFTYVGVGKKGGY
ncbi:iron transporter [Salinisphaera sp. USBA-960]|uniref:iron transporter n=1 Tax=Salinisphaera orenii TaxID=856731 RepID=UPI000DBE9C53|nr:iron transporter [Salifodinibacter halophilus]NNC26608.1 iron transporter [Salifodinibacter halophilus]